MAEVGWMLGKDQGVVRVYNSGKCDGTDFLAPPTLLQVCRHLAVVLEKGATLLALQGVWECCAISWIVVGRDQGVWGVYKSGK